MQLPLERVGRIGTMISPRLKCNEGECVCLEGKRKQRFGLNCRKKEIVLLKITERKREKIYKFVFWPTRSNKRNMLFSAHFDICKIS